MGPAGALYTSTGLGSKAAVSLALLVTWPLFSICPSASWKPLSWIQERLALKYREQASPEELAEARRRQAEQGQGSIFESIPEVAKDAAPSEIVVSPSKKSKKYTEVRHVLQTSR